MSDEIKPIDEAKKTALVLKEKREGLKKSIGEKFVLGEKNAKVTDFYPDKNLAGKVADAFLVNFGNPNRSEFIHCEEFLTNYKGVK